MKFIACVFMFAALGLTRIAPTALADSPPPYLFEWHSAGPGPDSLFSPYGIAVGGAASAYVYVCDVRLHRILKFSKLGSLLGQWPSSAVSLAVGPQGEVYAPEVPENRLTVYDESGTVLRQWGPHGGQTTPIGQAVGLGPTGDVYVIAGFGVQRFANDGTFILDWGGKFDPTFSCPPGTFFAPVGIAVAPNGNVYVSDVVQGRGCQRVQEFTGTGSFVNQWFVADVRGLHSDQFGYIYWSRAGLHNSQIEKHSGDGALVWTLGSIGTDPGQFYSNDCAIDSYGNIFVADLQSNRIEVFGNLTTPAPRATWGTIRRLYR